MPNQGVQKKIQDRSPRSTREQETREDWQFPEPGKDPLTQDVIKAYAKRGLRLRWIRFMTRGSSGPVEDQMNINRRRREGWEPVTYEEIGQELPLAENLEEFGRLSKLVVYKDCALFKCPDWKVAEREKVFRERAQAPERAIRQQLGQESVKGTPHMPIYDESQSRVQVGTGRPVEFAQDKDVEFDVN